MCARGLIAADLQAMASRAERQPVLVSATKPSFQMPLEWPVAVAACVARKGDDAICPIRVTVVGFATPSTTDVGGASLRLVAVEGGSLAEVKPGSYSICLRREGEEKWLPGIACIPGDDPDRDGHPRTDKLEAMIMVRPNVRGGVTFLHDAVLRAWAPVGADLELVVVELQCEFSIDDASGPWLRDRICIVSSSVEDNVLAKQGTQQASSRVPFVVDMQLLDEMLEPCGLRRTTRVERAPDDEWDLARQGQLHRDCKEYHEVWVNNNFAKQSEEQHVSFV